MTGITAKPLRGLVRGDVLVPGALGYDTARRGWNGMIDRRPALIVRCLDAADVAQALRFAVGEGLAVTVRGGGHNVAGTAVADGALMIDLSRMRSVVVDPAVQLAVADGGALLADVDAATTPHGLACPAGVVSETGLGGLALGGGYGWLARKWGLTCDHIVAAEVVLVDGSVLRVSERNRPDLLWGLRGGGGNFGVVTRFTLRLRPVADVWYGSAVFPLADAAEALRAYRAFAPRQPRDLQVVGALKHASPAPWVPAALHGRPVLSMSAIWLGEPGEGAAAVAELFGDPGAAATTGGVRSFAAVQASADGAEPAGRRYFTKSCYLGDLPDPAIDVLLAAAADNPSPYSAIDLGYLLGAITGSGVASSAFPRREAPYICSASAAWTDPALDVTASAWSRALVAALAPWQSGGSYLNYTTPESPEVTAARYGPEVYARLARLKAEFDPANVLRGNHNVTPGMSRTGGNRPMPLAHPAPPRIWRDGQDDLVAALTSPWYRLVSGVHDTVLRTTYQFAHSRGVRALHFPITTRTITCPTGLGSDSVPVPVAVNGVHTYLADSMQFMLEYGCRIAGQGCHNVLPCFRGDKPDARHLGQFVHSEAEIPGDLDDLIEYVEGYLRAIASAVLDEHASTLADGAGGVAHLERMVAADGGFARLTFAEAAKLLGDGPGVVVLPGGGRALDHTGERRLMDQAGEFVWVTHYDHLSVPFYQAFADGDEQVAANADLFFGIGEVVGSGERHTDGELVRKALALHEVPEHEYAWYIRMKDRFPMPTAGFGLGLERLLLWILRHDDIRDIPFVSRVGEQPEWPASVDRP